MGREMIWVGGRERPGEEGRQWRWGFGSGGGSAGTSGCGKLHGSSSSNSCDSCQCAPPPYLCPLCPLPTTHTHTLPLLPPLTLLCCLLLPTCAPSSPLPQFGADMNIYARMVCDTMVTTVPKSIVHCLVGGWLWWWWWWVAAGTTDSPPAPCVCGHGVRLAP